ncbi:MAG: hypothetical protein KKE73_16425 [Proteobacteria bacterium]|nr:hypothetical protein [Pseudomonadota bacterium]
MLKHWFPTLRRQAEESLRPVGISFKKGVLHVTLPKAEPSQLAQKIKIES